MLLNGKEIWSATYPANTVLRDPYRFKPGKRDGRNPGFFGGIEVGPVSSIHVFGATCFKNAYLPLYQSKPAYFITA